MKFADAVLAAKEGKRIRPKDSAKDFIFYDYGTFRWVHAAGGKVELCSIDELAGEWEIEGGEAQAPLLTEPESLVVPESLPPEPEPEPKPVRKSKKEI